jgi:hypothetical protein
MLTDRELPRVAIPPPVSGELAVTVYWPLPGSSVAPIEVVATTPPLWLVERSASVRLVKPNVVVVAFVVVLWSMTT